MRASVLGLLFPLLLGCSGQNVVAGDEKSNAEQLEASLPSWCQGACSKLAACPANGTCDCDPEGCTCYTVDADCPEKCQEEMTRFTTGGDECAAIGQRYQDCIDANACAIADQQAVCQMTDDERAACPGPSDEDSVEPTPTTDGPPVVGTGGSAPGSGGPNYPGAPVTCQGAYGSGGGAPAGGSFGSQVTCEEGRDSCSDGHDYSWICAVGSQGQTACSCLLDEQVVGAFDPGPGCPLLTQVNAGCGWNLTSGS